MVLVVTDLILRSRIVEGAQKLGYEVAVADSVEAARQALRSAPAALLVLDLQAKDVPWREVLAAAKEGGDDRVPVLAYGQHTKPALLRTARTAGCGLVVPRSRMVEELPSLIRRVREIRGAADLTSPA